MIFKPETFVFPVNQIINEGAIQLGNESTHKEAHLVWEQLYWLHSLSERMLKLTFKFSH